MSTAAYLRENDLRPEHLVFERELECCRRRLYPAALRLTCNASDAEDLVQETLTRAYAGLRGYTPGSNAAAWLRRIMANAFANNCRKRSHEPVQVPSPGIEAAHPTAPVRAIGGAVAQAPSAEDEVLRQFAHSELRAALDGLPDCFKATIYLADVEGYSYYDVAEMIGVPIGTVMSRLHRARNRLRRQLAAEIPAEIPGQAVTESVAI